MMPDPNKPVLTPAQLAAVIGERIPNTDHPLATCLVLGADGSDVRCNVKDFDPEVFQLSPNTDNVPPNAPEGFQRAAKTPAAPAATGTLAAPVAPASAPPAAPQYEGAPQVFTMPTNPPGSFFRSDSMGRRLNPSDYPSQAEAVASPVTLNGFTGEPLSA